MWIIWAETFEIIPSPRVCFIPFKGGSSTPWRPLAHQKRSVKEQSSLKVRFAYHQYETYLSTSPLYLALQRGGNLQLQLCQPWHNCWGINSCSLFPSSHCYRQNLSNICINSLLPIYYPGEAELIKYQPQNSPFFQHEGVCEKSHSSINFPCSTRRAKLETHQPEDIFSSNLHFNGRAEDLLLSARSW